MRVDISGRGGTFIEDDGEEHRHPVQDREHAIIGMGWFGAPEYAGVKNRPHIPTDMDAISVRDLHKSYGAMEAVKGISFDVPEGSFFAFLGPNGAGKSTTISIICSLLGFDSGEVLVFGKPVTDTSVKRDIGVVFQDPMMDGRLTVRENLSLRGGMYGLSGDDLRKSVERAIRASDSTEFADRRYGRLSGGQRRRADIARALVHGPRLLLLDEPTSGLDPKTRKRIWETITRLNREDGMTVLLTTHYMEEAAGADDVVIVNHGEVAAHGSPTSLREQYCSDRMVIVPTDRERVLSVLDSNGVGYSVRADTVEIPLSHTVDAVPLIAMLDGMMESLEVRNGTLDDAFIMITGEEME